MHIRHEHKKGEAHIYPLHKFVSNWKFSEGEEREAILADALAEVAEKNGFSSNDMHHLVPAVLRMLNSDVAWACNPKGKE